MKDTRKHRKSSRGNRTRGDLTRQIVQCLMPARPGKIILFGSRARREADQFSDVDLLVILETKDPFLERLKRLYQLWTLPFSVDILAYTPEECDTMHAQGNPLIEDALTHGKVLYEAPS